MKGKLTQSQMILAAAGGALLLVAVAMGYFGWSSLGEVQVQAQALAERKVKPELAAILTRPGGAGAARKEAGEIVKLEEELTQEEEGLVGSWQEGYVQASGVGQGWSQDPNQWKDRLIASYDRLKKQSGKKGDNSRVILADDFYLGLQDYKQQNPPAEKVPDLARQLSVAEKLVELLMESKKSAREAYPTQCLMQSIVGPGVSEPEAGKLASEKAKQGVNSTNYLREGYTLQFECSPEVLYGFIQRVVASPWLFVVVNLSLENDMKEFPKRSEIARRFSDGKNSGAGAPGVMGNVESGADGAVGTAEASTQPPLLMVLAGKERLKVVVRIDFVGWRAPGAAKPSEKGKI
jgi:hypothetical protein